MIGRIRGDDQNMISSMRLEAGRSLRLNQESIDTNQSKK